MNNKIMVVDDELSIRKLLDRAFSKKGYDIITAESGVEALKILKDILLGTASITSRYKLK